jgi:hypothetical protein
MTTRAQDRTPGMLSIYVGRQCVGHVIRRGKLGVEAYDIDGNSIGMFACERDAADALELAAEQESGHA